VNVTLWAWYRALIALRKAMKSLQTAVTTVQHRAWCLEEEQVLLLHRWDNKEPNHQALVIISFNRNAVRVRLQEPKGRWQLALHSGRGEFGGDEVPGPVNAFIPSDDVILFPPFGVSVFTLLHQP
jgi:hypothetical protein